MQLLPFMVSAPSAFRGELVEPSSHRVPCDPPTGSGRTDVNSPFVVRAPYSVRGEDSLIRSW